MAVESPVAVERAMTRVEEPTYLDEHAGSLDSAGRRLSLAEDGDAPLHERVRLLADVGRFVDEFFQLTGHHDDGVCNRAEALLDRQGATLARLRGPLAEGGLELCDWRELPDEDRSALTTLFRERIASALSPLVVETEEALRPAANLSLNVAALVVDTSGRQRLAAVELPPVNPRFVRVRPQPGGTGVQVLPVEQVAVANLAMLFPSHRVEARGVFRVTRRGGVNAAPGSDDLLASVERQLRHERHAPAARLEVDGSMPAELVERLRSGFGLDPEHVFRVGGFMGMADLASLPLPEARDVVRHRFPAPTRSDLFEALDRRDMLVHFPYESYADSVIALLERSSADPALIAIKQTLYRASPDGPTVRALVRAAERGASVVAVVELAARLDESRSVACARALERAGAHVVYGLVGMRTHCPLTLVIRNGANGPLRYGVVGTGLHHPDRRPEGVSLLSADPDVTADLADLFNYLTGYSRPTRFRKLLVGPGHLRSRLLELIRRETAAGPAGRIVLKVYRLVDREVIDSLYQASQRGVRIDLVVSGACSLRPGVPGLSDNVRVLATLGRHFETSRLFAFGTGEPSVVYLSSGDLSLALGRQVDVAAPVEDPAHRARLQSTLQALVDFAAREMDDGGAWHRRGPGPDDALRTLCAGSASGPMGRGGGNFAR